MAEAKKSASFAERERRKSVIAVGVVCWLVLCAALAYAFFLGALKTSSVSGNFLMFVIYDGCLAVAILVVTSAFHDRVSIKASYRFFKTNSEIHKVTFDFLKNSALSAAAVTVAGKAFAFLFNNLGNPIPSAFMPFIPKATLHLLFPEFFAVFIFYVGCAFLFLLSFLQFRLGVRKAADEQMQKKIVRTKKGVIPPIINQFFRRKVGILSFFAICSLTSLFVFILWFIYPILTIR